MNASCRLWTKSDSASKVKESSLTDVFVCFEQMIQLVNKIIYGNIYCDDEEGTGDDHQQPQASHSLREGILLLHRGGLASFRWIKWALYTHTHTHCCFVSILCWHYALFNSVVSYNFWYGPNFDLTSFQVRGPAAPRSADVDALSSSQPCWQWSDVCCAHANCDSLVWRWHLCAENFQPGRLRSDHSQKSVPVSRKGPLQQYQTFKDKIQALNREAFSLIDVFKEIIV